MFSQYNSAISSTHTDNACSSTFSSAHNMNNGTISSAHDWNSNGAISSVTVWPHAPVISQRPALDIFISAFMLRTVSDSIELYRICVTNVFRVSCHKYASWVMTMCFIIYYLPGQQKQIATDCFWWLFYQQKYLSSAAISTVVFVNKPGPFKTSGVRSNTVWRVPLIPRC